MKGKDIILLVIMAFYLVFAVVYNAKIPAMRAPDESAHFIYIKHLVQYKSLPIFTSAVGNYEAHQPPLYYLICSLFYRVFRVLDEQSLVHVLRFLSTIFGLVLLYLTYRISEKVFPRNDLISLGSCAWVGLMPVSIAIGAVIGNDGLTALVFALGLLVILQGLKSERGFDLKISFWLGVVLGLGLLTKTVAVILVPVALLAIYSKGRATFWRSVGIMVLPMLLIWGWWGMRNQLLYGDPFCWRRFEEIFSGRPHPDYFLSRGFSWLQYWQLVGTFTFASFFGFVDFAGMWVFTPFSIYVILGVLSILALTGLLMLGLRRWNHLSVFQKHGIIVLVFGVFLILISHLRFNLIFFQAQARYLSPLIGGMGLLFILGLQELLPARWRVVMVLMLIGVLAWGCIVSLVYYIIPFYGV